MDKPKTTKQHLLDKLTLGKLPLPERHKKMSQFGPKGDCDQKLENAIVHVEFDTSQCANLIDHRELRARQFLTMATIFIEQMDNELHQEVAKHVLHKYRTEDAKTIEMQYQPKHLTKEISEKYGTLENYAAALSANYKQVALENWVSKMFSAIPKRIQKSYRAEVTDSQFERDCRLVEGDIHSWQKLADRKIYLGSIAITPEEYSELHSNLVKSYLDDWLFEEAAMKANRWLDETQSKYDPDEGFYNSYFNAMIQQRIKDLKGKKSARPIGDLVQESESDINDEEFTEHILFNSDCTDSTAFDDVADTIAKVQVRSIIEEWEERLPPKQERLLALHLRGYSREEIAEKINGEFPETFLGSGKPKDFKASNVQYALNKLEEHLEQWLRRSDVLSDDEKFPGLTRDYKSTKDHNASNQEEGNNE